jgi:hypothetical protein
VGIRLWREPGKALKGDVVFQWGANDNDTLVIYGMPHVDFNGDSNRFHHVRGWDQLSRDWDVGLDDRAFFSVCRD